MRTKITFMGAAIAATIATPALAQNSVTLYGVVDDSIAYVSNQQGHSNVYMRQGNLYSSRWGLRGSEDLGEGWKAIFDLQAGFDPNSGAQASAGTLFNRQAFVGLQNDQYGTFTMGRQYTSMWDLVAPLNTSSNLTGATGAHPGDIDGMDTTIRANSSVKYTTSNYAGLQASVMYGFGGEAGTLQGGNMMSAALKYARGPFAIAAGYLYMHSSGVQGTAPSLSYGTSAVDAGYVVGSSMQDIVAAGTYQFGNATFGLNYSNVKFRPGDQSVFKDTAIFNTFGGFAKYVFNPAFDVAAGYSFTKATNSNGISDGARYHQVSMKEAYHLSKRTTIYAIQGWQHATGQTLDAEGNVIVARPVVGDLNNTMPSSSENQFAALLGLAVSF
jgi:predicted porin